MFAVYEHSVLNIAEICMHMQSAYVSIGSRGDMNDHLTDMSEILHACIILWYYVIL